MSTPFLCAAVGHILASVTIAFVDPAALTKRYLTFLLIVLFVCGSIITTSGTSFRHELFSMYMFGYGLHAHYFLCLMRISSPGTSSGGKPLSSVEKWTWAIKSLFTPRRPRQANTSLEKNQDVPTRAQFLIKKSWTFVWSYSLYDLLTTFPFLPVFLHQPPSFQPAHGVLFTRLPSITQDGLVTRIYITANSVFSSYLSLLATHTACSIAAVAVFNSPVSSWSQPLFGPISAAYSLRRYFSHFWHHLMRPAFTANASWLIQTVLRVPQDSPCTRPAILFLAFLASGLMHTVAGQAPAPCAHLGPLYYNIAFAVAIVGEDLLQREYLRYVKRIALVRSDRVKMLERCAGYAWVVLWHLEAIPRVIYPTIYCHSKGVTQGLA